MSERGQAGRVVGGRFELLERLGSGGMGTVWRARDVGLHREVAIKEVRPADAALYDHNPALAAQQRERVLRESRALARLQHPNVVSIYQIIESEDSPYPWIVMELVRGTSLDARIRDGERPLTPAEAARIGRDVLGALRAAHAAGIMHRDVKPGNVLLRTDGSAVLTDFGIAAMHDSTQLTATGELIGSPEYIAPERLRGDETRTASDLWSLAMLLYVAVEGYHPLRRATTLATLAAVMTDPVPPPRRAGPLGPALSAVLVTDPAARPTGEQFDQLLAAAEHGAYGPPTPAGPAFPTPPGGSLQPGRPYPAYQQPYPSRPAARSGARTGAIVLSLAAVAIIAVVAAFVVPGLISGDDTADPGGRTGTTTTTDGATEGATVPGGETETGTEPPSGTRTIDVPEELYTPEGARATVAALTEVMGGSKVSELTLYTDYAMATGPAKDVPNGFDDFTFRDGTATREGPDTVDADRAVLDLGSVNWDALPALWQRAEKDLGIAKPTQRYVIVDTDIIDGHPELKLYLIDDYGAAYLQADLAGNVVELFPRDG